MNYFKLFRALAFTTVFLTIGTLIPSGVILADSRPTENILRSFLNKHLKGSEGVVVAERGGQYYVRFEGPSVSGVVKVHRNVTRAVDGGQKLVEKPLGTARVRNVGNDTGTIRLLDDDTGTLRLGDRFRPQERAIHVHNQSELSRRTIRNLLSEYSQFKSVKFVEEPGTNDSILLRIRNDQLVYRDPSGDSFQEKIALDETEKKRSKKTGRVELRDRARFDRPIHDFEWVDLPTRGSIRILMLASDDTVGFARYDETLGTTHWVDMDGTALDVSFVRTSDENPGELFVLAVIQRNDKIRTRAFTFNALDRSVQHHWSEPDAWIRRIGSDGFVQQKIGLNSPWSEEVRPVRVSRDGWERTESSISLPSGIIPRGYTATGSSLAYLDDDGRLNVRKQNTSLVRGTAPFGELPQSISSLRNDRESLLHPEFPVRNGEEGYRIFLPENIASGITFIQGLRNLRKSRLYHLKVTEGNIETLWESNRLSGYVSGTDWHDDRYWAMVVNPENQTSTLQSFSSAKTSY